LQIFRHYGLSQHLRGSPDAADAMTEWSVRASVVTLVSFARDLASSAGSTLACAPASRRRTLAALCTKARGVASPDRVALAVLRQHPDPPHALGRLRARCELSGRSAPENREKFAPSHFVIMVSDRILRPEIYHVAASRAVLCISAKSAARLPLRVDAVEKGILAGSVSNVASRSRAHPQSWFKNSSAWIRSFQFL